MKQRHVFVLLTVNAVLLFAVDDGSGGSTAEDDSFDEDIMEGGGMTVVG
ncbi:MAG: hypothetical protein LBT13_10200 [Treponema sp.]|jgi:hypothetical protein|nr:hypothetical protein [Treponema sp.]